MLAVEASGIASLCEDIVKENKLENIIEVIYGSVETISLPEGIQHVDIIVSEWMGFYLLHESMLDSVIVARDRFLAPDGIMVPSHASLFFAPVDMTEHFQDRAEEWSNIYGFDFSPVASLINMEEVSKPLITIIRPNALSADPKKVMELDLKTVKVRDVQKLCTVLKFPFKQDTKVSGFAVWFHVEFNTDCGLHNKCSTTVGEGLITAEVNEQGDACSFKISSSTFEKPESGLQDHSIIDNDSRVMPSELSPVVLGTGPLDPPTHWKQTVIFLPRTIMVGDGINLCCRVSMHQDNSNKRHYIITVTLIDEDDPDDEDCDDEEQVCDISDFGDSDASEKHGIPCDCGSSWCRLAAAVAESYELEQQKLVEEDQAMQQKTLVS